MKEIRDIKLDLLMGNQNLILDLFYKITSGIEIINCNVYNSDESELIYHKDGQWIFYQDCKNEKFWAHYKRYWEILKSEFSLEYEEIQAITKLLVEEALKREVPTPNTKMLTYFWRVEEALKREVPTPCAKYGYSCMWVEEALKREVPTPNICPVGWHVPVEEALKREVPTPIEACNNEYILVEEALKRELTTPFKISKYL